MITADSKLKCKNFSGFVVFFFGFVIETKFSLLFFFQNCKIKSGKELEVTYQDVVILRKYLDGKNISGIITSQVMYV